MLKRLVSNASWLALSRVASDIASFGLFVVIARTHGFEGVGAYSLGFGVATFVGALVGFGIDQYGIRECTRVAGADRLWLMRQLVTIQVTATLVCAGVIFGLLQVLDVPPSLESIVIVLSVSQIAQSCANTLFVPAFADQRMVAPSIAFSVCRIGGVMTTIGIILHGAVSLSEALLPMAGASLVLLGVAVVSSVRSLRSSPWPMGLATSLQHVRELWSFAASGLIAQLDMRIGLFVLAYVGGDRVAGVYATNVKFLEVGILPIFFLGMAFYPDLCRAFVRSADEFIVVADRFLRLGLVTGGMLSWGISFVLPLLVVPVFGADAAQVIPYLWIVSLVAIFTSLEVVFYRLLPAVNRQQSLLFIQTGGLVLNIVLMALLVPHFGVWGAIAGYGLFSIAINVSLLKALSSRVDLSGISRAIAGFYLAFSFACVAGAAASRLAESAVWVPILPIVAFVVASIFLGFFEPRAVLRAVRRGDFK